MITNLNINFKWLLVSQISFYFFQIPFFVLQQRAKVSVQRWIVTVELLSKPASIFLLIYVPQMQTQRWVKPEWNKLWLAFNDLLPPAVWIPGKCHVKLPLASSDWYKRGPPLTSSALCSPRAKTSTLAPLFRHFEQLDSLEKWFICRPCATTLQTEFFCFKKLLVLWIPFWKVKVNGT